MRACEYAGAGDASVLRLVEVADPEPGPGDIVIDVASAGLNRADIAQRAGSYPPPPGASPLPGLEVSGTVAIVGADVSTWAVGDRVCALLAGGGYAERVAVDARHVLRVPDGMAVADAAALPEATATVHYNVFSRGRLREGETLLVHGGSSGIGTMAIQLAKARGARVAVTAGSAAKLDACARLGADVLIDYREQDFVAALLDQTDGRGADVVLDPVGGTYLARDIRALAPEGRIVLIGTQGGADSTIPLGALMTRRGEVHATTLRSQSAQAKAEIVRAVRDEVWPLVVDGRVRPVIDSRFPLDRAGDAQRRMESSEHVGKILLSI
ncbi:NAD(P)H-quinone oxidoreductase [Planctomonas psychrotolerans]|uniref:NAD(P)H-quinone oxidoreductase n=1 Tax=Planctomonas psychrotolerans TaxID=2528712 RepID=UPI00123B6E22|nr:NAD(P)H-quinone oxidoreductase [Planctomonas psychrotolerans]